MTAGADTAVPPAATAPTPKPNSFQRIAGVLFAPATTFADIARRPDVLVPLLVLVALSILSTIVLVPRIDFEGTVREQMESQGRGEMSEADMERAVRFGAAGAKVFAYVSPIFGIIFLAIIAGVLLLAFRLMGGEGDFKQAFSVTTYASMPTAIKSIIMSVIIMGRGEIGAEEMATVVMSNPGAFIDPKTQPILFAALTSLDLFTIWMLVLLSIGFAYVSKFSKVKSAVIVFSLWLVTVVIKLAFATMGAAAKAAKSS